LRLIAGSIVYPFSLIGPGAMHTHLPLERRPRAPLEDPIRLKFEAI
jgi:hypothetical protein